MRNIKTILVVALAMLAVTGTTYAKKKKKDAKADAVVVNDFPAYLIYNAAGEKVTYTDMLADLLTHDVCLFGEFHDDPISHWLEKELTNAMYAAKKDSLVLGGEMWETDQQLIMDELLSGYCDKKNYTAAANNWPNFRDYKPLVGIAIRNNLPFICTNIPRRYASIIYKKGNEYLDSLSDQAKSYLPPLPIHYDLTQPAYASMLSLFAKPDPNSKNPMARYQGENLVKAQAIKDATMAHNILKHWDEDKYFMHYNGVYHSKNNQSIVYYLKHYKPEIDVVTISVSRQENVLELDEANNTGSYNIVVHKTMTTTYD